MMRGVTWCPLALFCAGILSSLSSWGFYIGCEFVYISVLLCREHTIALKLSTTSRSKAFPLASSTSQSFAGTHAGMSPSRSNNDPFAGAEKDSLFTTVDL